MTAIEKANDPSSPEKSRDRLPRPPPALGERAGDSRAAARRARLALLLTILTVGGAYLLGIREGHSWGDDFSQYIHHAKNIVEGVAYEQTGHIYNPAFIVGPRTYPPVFPLMLTPVYQWFGMNLTAMKVEVILIFLLSLLLIYLTFRNHLPWPYLIALVVAVGSNPYFWQFKENIVSDLPFLLFTYLTLYLIERAYRPDRARRPETFDALLIGGSIYLAYGTRSVGLVLAPCLLAYDLIKNRRPTGLAVKSVCLAAALILLQNVFSHSDSGYADQIGIKRVVSRNILEYSRGLAEYWTNGYSKLLVLGLLGALSSLALIGYLSRFRARITHFEIFPIFYLAPFTVLSLGIDSRYLMPVVPLYLFYAFLGIRVVSRRPGVERAMFATVMAVIVASYAGQYTRLNYGPIPEGVAKRETLQLFEYVKGQTGEKDVFIFRKPRAFALYTGRRTSVWARGSDDQKQWDYFRKIHANYLVAGPKEVEPADQRYISSFIERHRDRLQETYSNADFRVYRITEVP